MTESKMSTPLYAVAGAGDLLAEQLKKLASQAPELQARAQDLRVQLQARAADLPRDLRQIGQDLPRDLQALAADLPSYAAQLQTRARNIDADKVNSSVRKNVETASARAQDLYTELVKRGQRVVNRSESDSSSSTPGKEPMKVGIKTAVRTAARTTAKKTAPKASTRPADSETDTEV